MVDNLALETRSLPLPIDPQARQIARQFALQQPNSVKAKQVYLNTLAVLAARHYLRLMGIDTDLRASDCWNPVVRLGADVADLEVTGLGRLECRPVQIEESPGATVPEIASTHCHIPPEVWEQRLGYLAVAIAADGKTATLLGFSATAGQGEIALADLEPLDALLVRLDALIQPARANLSGWLRDRFDAGWQSAEALLTVPVRSPDRSMGEGTSSQNLAEWFQHRLSAGWQQLNHWLGRPTALQVQFRGPVGFQTASSVTFNQGQFGSRPLPDADVVGAKLIDLGLQLGTQPVALLVALSEERDSPKEKAERSGMPQTLHSANILVQLHPAGYDDCLPPHVQLQLLSEAGDLLQAVESRGQDLWIQLRPFKVQSGTNFRLQLTLADVTIAEAFSV